MGLAAANCFKQLRRREISWLANLAAPEGRVIGREVAIRDPERSLQLNGIARGQRDHGLEPEAGCECDMGGGDFAEGAADFCGAVQHKSPAHAGGGAGVDLVEQGCAEEVGACGWCGKQACRGVKCAVIVIVGGVEADLRPGADARIVVVVRVSLEPGQLGLVDDAIGVINAQTVEEGAAVGGDREAKAVRAKQAQKRLGDKAGLQRQPEIIACGLFVHGVEQIASAALGHGFCGPEGGVQLGRERVGSVRRRAQAKPGHFLQCRWRNAAPA